MFIQYVTHVLLTDPFNLEQMILFKAALTMIILFAFPIHANDAISKEKLIALLVEAEDYLSVKPSRSLKILSAQENLSYLSESQFFRWHITSIRAALSFNDLVTIEQSIKALIAHKSTTEFERRIVPILSSIGIWLRKSEYFEQAKLTLICALTHNKIAGNKVKLLTSIAIVSRYLNQSDYAVNTYNLAKSIAKNKNMPASLATIENNLGVIYLENGSTLKAERHFREALARYQASSNRSGNIISGINLLQTFLIQDQQVNFQRLSPSITRLTEAFPNESKQSSIFWLNTVFRARQGVNINDKIKAQLIESFNNISDRKLQFSLKKHFADELKIKVNLPNKIRHEKMPPRWFKEIDQCDWATLKNVNLADLK